MRLLSQNGQSRSFGTDLSGLLHQEGCQDNRNRRFRFPVGIRRNSHRILAARPMGYSNLIQ